MKTLRFIGIALLTVLLSVSFSACGGSNDDDADNGSVIESGGGQTAIKMRLAKMTIESNSGYTEVREFTYDHNGKLLQYSKLNYYKLDPQRTPSIYTYTYTNNSILEVNNKGEKSEYILENGLIVKYICKSYTETYDYDNNNRMITNSRYDTSGSLQSKFNIIWSGDNIVREDVSRDKIIICEYSSYIAPPNFDCYFDSSIIFRLGHFGKLPKNLLSRQYDERNGKIIWEENYEWVIEKGLPVKAILMKYEKSTYETYTITYEWK